MLDYLSFGVPVVTTSIGAQGFQQTGEEPFVVCDEAAEFTAQVIAFLTDAAFAARLSTRCEAYAKLFSPEETYRRLDEMMAAIVQANSPGASPGATPA